MKKTARSARFWLAPITGPTRRLPVLLLLVGCAWSGPLSAHEVSSLNGQQPTHQHVYKRNDVGKGLTSGHYARPPGSNGIVIWSASPTRAYGRSQPGIRIPNAHVPQPSQRQVFKQEPVFRQHGGRSADSNRR